MPVESHTHDLLVAWTWRNPIDRDEQRRLSRFSHHFVPNPRHAGLQLHHSHKITITDADITAAVDKEYVIDNGNHRHTVTITGVEFLVIQTLGLAYLAGGLTGIVLTKTTTTSGPTLIPGCLNP